MSNDYQTLMSFIATQAASATPAPGESLRDLQDYVVAKFNNTSNDQGDVVLMVTRALKVAGLDDSTSSAAASTLNQPGQEKKRAVAAALMAMSIIRDTDKEGLKANKLRLDKMLAPAILSELGALLTKGDSSISRRHPKLELKNFKSTGTLLSRYTADVEDAFSRTHDMLLKCEMTFLFLRGPLSGRIATAFNDYFGDPNATIDTTTIPFQSGAGRPTFPTAVQPRVAVVREVMKRVCRNFVRQNVRISFGGKSIDAGTNAYVSGKTNPTKVHVAAGFFNKPKIGLSTAAGTIVHECTHTFARTDDHKYQSDPCKAMALTKPAKALSNADSYRFFVEAAFGS